MEINKVKLHSGLRYKSEIYLDNYIAYHYLTIPVGISYFRKRLNLLADIAIGAGKSFHFTNQLERSVNINLKVGYRF